MSAVEVFADVLVDDYGLSGAIVYCREHELWYELEYLHTK